MTGGEEIYSALVDQYVQLPISPEEIHRIGTHWATEVNADEWVEIGSPTLGARTREDVFEKLHSDPELRFSSAEEMLELTHHSFVAYTLPTTGEAFAEWRAAGFPDGGNPASSPEMSPATAPAASTAPA